VRLFLAADLRVPEVIGELAGSAARTFSRSCRGLAARSLSRFSRSRRRYGLVITTTLVLQTGQLNRHSSPPSSRGTKALRCIRTSQVGHFEVGMLLSAGVCMFVLAGAADPSAAL
jgi:hypothetical protein